MHGHLPLIDLLGVSGDYCAYSEHTKIGALASVHTNACALGKRGLLEQALKQNFTDRSVMSCILLLSPSDIPTSPWLYSMICMNGCFPSQVRHESIENGI